MSEDLHTATVLVDIYQAAAEWRHECMAAIKDGTLQKRHNGLAQKAVSGYNQARCMINILIRQ